MDIQHFLQILWARRYVVLGTFAATVLAALGLTLLLPDKYDATTALLITFRDQQTQTLPVQLSPSYMATQLDIIQSQNAALKVVDKLKLADAPAAREAWQQATSGQGSLRHWLADRLRNELTIEPARESRVLNLSYRGTDPRFVATLANAFADAYIETNLELSVDPARRDSAWLESQLTALRQRLEEAQSRLSAFQRERGIVATDERLDIETARLNELSSQLVQAEGLMHDAETRQQELTRIRKGGGSIESLREFSTDSYLQSLKVDLARREADLVQLQEQYGVNHPQLQRTEAELASLRGRLATALARLTRSVANEADIAHSRVETLRKELDAQRAKVLAFKEARDQMPTLERDVMSAQAAYDVAAQRYNESQLQSRVSDTNVAVLTPAVPPTSPSSPNLRLNLVVAVFMGTLLGVGLALLLELLLPKVRSPRMLEQRLNLPVLGVLEGPA
jgi:chain length determinant protein EpsF